VFHRHNQWVRVIGKVLDRQVLPGPRAPHPKLVIVELHPEGGMPLQAEVRLIPGDRNHWDEDLYYPSVGDITGFIVDPASGETRFDMTDPRNSMAAHTAAGEAWAAAPDDDDDEPTPVDSGPPWLVPAACPTCGRPVNQKMAAMERQPHCMTCAQFLPAYPVVTSQLRNQSLS